MATRVVDVSEVLDRLPLGRLQYFVIALCAATVFVDGFDTQVIGYVAPVLRRSFGLSPKELGTAFAAGLFGLALGAFFVAPVADRIGRRPVIIGSVTAFGLLTLATAGAGSFHALVVLRFLTGIGLGGAIPNAIALTADWSPAKRQASIVMIMFCGFPLGAMVGGLVAAQLLHSHGWQSVFVAGGALTLALAPVLALTMPESIRLLAGRGDRNSQVARLMSRFSPTEDWLSCRMVAGAERQPARSVRELFRGELAVVTLLLWVVYFMGLLDLYLLANWLPTTLHAAGTSLETAVIATSLLQAGGLIGALSLGFLVGRAGPFLVMPLAYAAGAVCVVGIGLFGGSAAGAIVTAFGSGFTIVGCQNCNNGLAASLYPSAVRATGVGWANAIGRFGSIVGPTLGGFMLSWGLDMTRVFLFSAIPALCAALSVIAIGRLSDGKMRRAAVAEKRGEAY